MFILESLESMFQDLEEITVINHVRVRIKKVAMKKKSTFKCKFDEQLLGMAEIVESSIGENFENNFADDIKREGIRGQCDEYIVAAASVKEEERTIITNDKDFLFGVKNKKGVIVLWGGLQIAERPFQSFRNLRKKQKCQAILTLFERYVKDMEEVRESGDRRLAVLSYRDDSGEMAWEFRPPDIDMKLKWLTKKEGEQTDGGRGQVSN